MSADHARAFMEKMKSDVAFSESIIAIENIAERFNFIKDAGFDCSAAEIEEVQSELSELSDDALDRLAGGANVYLINYSR